MRRYVLLLVVAMATVLVGTSTPAGAASRNASAAQISARLTKTSFTSTQAGSVKLIYRFSAKSKRFSYLLTVKRGAKWQTVKRVRRTGSFKGSKSMTVKKVFAGKPVKIGSYRVKLSADGGSKLLSFKVVVAVKGHAPANTARPSISGTASQGHVLTASTGSWINSPTSYAYQWQRCNGASCSNISGATASTYTPVYADVGRTVDVIVTATNSTGSTSATSGKHPAGGTIVGLAPVNTVVPSISGTATQNRVLTTSNGSWDNSPTSYTYQWQRCNGASCSNIPGATASTYTLAGADTQRTVRVVVTGTNTYGSTPVTSVLTAFVSTNPSVSTGGDHSCALHSNGTIDCWGWNFDGALGDGTNTDSAAPVAVSGISDAIQLSAGWYHACALLSDGTIKCWGYNQDGELGNGFQTSSPNPVTVSGITDAIQVSAGNYHTCAVLSGGTVKCWGLNDSGQLGNDTTASSLTPVLVSNISTATQVSTGGYHSCARLSGGSLECWGYGGDGQLGDGLATSSEVPVVVSGVTNATQVSTGGYHSCAVLSTGTVACWGLNNNGQLGDGSTTYEPSPVTVGGISTATQVSAAWYDTCVRLSNGSLRCWGRNAHGELGDGVADHHLTNSSGEDISPNPVTVSGITTATAIGAGGGWKDLTRGGHSCALLANAQVKCWGWNNYGQLGNGTMTDSSTPVQVIFSAPAPIVLPTITGTATQGQALSTDTGTWTNSPTSWAYQWRRCNSSGASCTNIGTNVNTYTLTSSDVGHTVRVIVTASNASGSTVSASTQYPATGTIS